MTDSANYVRRRMKQYLRTCTLGQRTFRKPASNAQGNAQGNDQGNAQGNESKTESQERIEEKVHEEVHEEVHEQVHGAARGAAMYVASMDGGWRHPVEVPVRGLHASLRQLSDGTTPVLSLRTASSASSEEGRDLFRSSLSDHVEDGPEMEGDDDRYWKQLDSRWYTTLNLADGADGAEGGESKQEWCGPKCKQGHVMVHSSYKGSGYTSGYICDKCRGRSSNGHRAGT
jgi:hypothetical protein